MNDFYVYLHRRNDTCEVFYVGKGRSNRASKTNGRNLWWKRVVSKARGFFVEYVGQSLSEESAFALEVEVIQSYKDVGHKLCNMTSGGEGSSGFPCSEEKKIKLSAAHTGKILSDITKTKMSVAASNRIVTDAAKISMSKAATNKRAVKCSNGTAFESITKAADWCRVNGFPKVSKSYIGKCCTGTRPSAYGFKWSYILLNSDEGL